MRIGVFDSGVGGLTVLNTLISKYPNHEYIYYGDTKNMPYGNKSLDELEKLSKNIINFLIDKGAEVIVIACGTVSSNLYNKLKKEYDIPIYDIITPTINYLNNSNYNKIGLLATKATVESGIFKRNINKEVTSVACIEFVPLIEKNKINELNEYFNIYLDKVKNCDIVVLGCTHYPIIKEEIKKYLNSIYLLDMSECINLDLSHESNTQSIDMYFTKYDEELLNNIKKIFKYNINFVKFV